LELGSAAQRASGDFEAIGTVNAALTSHLGSTDPHPQYASEAKINAAITTHVAVADPHPQYTTETEVNTIVGAHTAAANPHSQYQTSAQVNTAIGTHTAAADPHPQYTTETEVNTIVGAHTAAANPHSQYQTSAQVNTAIGTHAAAADPHPQYTTEAEVNTAIGTHAVAADPHPQYTTDAEVNTIVGTHAAATNPHPQYQTSTQVSTAVSNHAALQGNGTHIPTNGVTDAQVASISAPKIAVAADSANNLAAGTLQATLASQAQNIFQLNQVQVRNQFPQLIGNGRFWITQRGSSFSISSVADGHTLDRWRIANSLATGTLSVGASATVPSIPQAGFYQQSSLSLRVTAAQAAISADHYSMLMYAIEGYNFQLIVQRRFTVSFWARSPVPGVYCLAARSGDYAQNFVAEYVVNTANTWEFKEVVIEPTPAGGTWNFTNGAGIRLAWILATGSAYHTAPGAWVGAGKVATANQVNLFSAVGNELLIANVQISPGTPTAMPSRDQDLLLNCYPYYQRIFLSAYDFSSNGANVGIETYHQLPIPMRSVPTAAHLVAGGRSNLSTTQPPIVFVNGNRQVRYVIYNAANGYCWAINELWELSSEL
jgi:hypothetical protein